MCGKSERDRVRGLQKAHAAKSGRVRGDYEKRMLLNSGRENRLLAVTDDAEGAAIVAQNYAPFDRQPGKVCSRMGEPHSHVVGLPWCPRHSSASTRHTGPFSKGSYQA